MCDGNIDLEQAEAMRQAFVTLRAAAQRVLAGRTPADGPTDPALKDLASACAVDPASFVIEPPALPRMHLHRHH